MSGDHGWPAGRLGSALARRRAVVALVLLALLGAGVAQNDDCSTSAWSTTRTAEEAAWLRINGVFVLHLAPRPPHLEGDSLVVPGRPIAHLLGLDYRWNEEARRGTFRGGGRSLSVQAGRIVAEAGGTSVPLPVPARATADGDDLFVPMRVLIDAFDLASSWDDAARVLSVHGATALDDPNIRHVFFREFAGQPVAREITPHQVVLRTTRPEAEGACPRLLLEVTAEGVDADGHRPTLYMMFRYRESIAIGGPFVHVSDDPANTSPDPCSLVTGRLTCRAQAQGQGLTFILGAYVSRGR